MPLILLIVLVFLFVALLPIWDYNAQWSDTPIVRSGLLVAVLTPLLIAGRLG